MALYHGRRIVTGHDAQGRSIVISDEAPKNVVPNPADPDRGHINFWRTENVPANNAMFADPMDGPPCALAPPKGGTMFRFVPFGRNRRMGQMFEAAGAAHVRVDTERHPSMHKTDSVDYIVLLKGEVTALLDVGEVQMKSFDVLIQRVT